MASGGGGAWKVAYADFVTAMMAFFLVMWIVAQDKSIKTEVSHYFVDPLGNHPIGRPSKSSSQGSLIETSTSGSVPEAESVAVGRGRHSNSDEKRDSQATVMVEKWLRTDDEQLDYWIEKAQATRKAVVKKSTIVTSQSEIEEEAAQKLASEMKNEVESKIPKECEGIYRDMLIESLQHIKWQEVAEDIMTY